jgi:hypothetical protein
MAEKQARLNDELTSLNIDTTKLKADSLKAVAAALKSFSNYDGDLGGFMQTPEWKALDQLGKEAIVQSQTGLAGNLQKIGTMNIQNEIRAAGGDLNATVAAANRLSATDGLDVKATVDEETGEVTLSSIYNDKDADNYQQSYGKPKTFGSAEEAVRYIGEMATDPILGADNFISREKDAATAVAAARQQGIENDLAFAEVRAKVIEALVGDLTTYNALDEEGKLAVDGKVVELMAPLIMTLGIRAERMGGMPDAGAEMRGEASEAPVADTEAPVVATEASNEAPAAQEGLTATSPKLDPMSNDVAERRAAFRQAVGNIGADDEAIERQMAYASRGGRPLGK